MSLFSSRSDQASSIKFIHCWHLPPLLACLLLRYCIQVTVMLLFAESTVVLVIHYSFKSSRRLIHIGIATNAEERIS